MKRLLVIFAAILLALSLALTACGGGEKDFHEISVSWGAGVEGAYFTQNGERLTPKNGKISTDSQADISVEVELKAGYRQTPPSLKADGELLSDPVLPVTAKSLEISATPNADVSLTLGNGKGYELRELKRIAEDVGYTVVVGAFLYEGYREISGPSLNIVSDGSEYEPVASLSPWGLDEVALKREGYAAFYKVRLLENASLDLSGVAPDGSVAEKYAAVTHAGGEGYKLIAAYDTNNDGISDGERELFGEVSFLKGAKLNIFIRRADGYSTKNAELFADGVKIVGTQGEGYDDSDPLSSEYIYPLTVTGDITLTVTGVEKLGEFTLRIMNSDGTERYHTYCKADTVAQALAQIPGNDERESEYYERWWEPKPAGGEFCIWRFVGGEFEEIDGDYTPARYENIYCGYLIGATPADPQFAPIIPPQTADSLLPSENLPESLVSAMQAVIADKSGDEDNRWVLAWASYKLYKAGVDVVRPVPFGYDNIFDLYLEDVLKDYKGVAANDLWVYAYDTERYGSSDINPAELKSSFLSGKSKRNWANQEAFFLEIVQDIFPDFEPKTSFTIGDTDDLNMTICLILDDLGKPWTLSGEDVNDFTVESYREYVKEHAKEGKRANVVKETLDYIAALAD